MLPSWTMSLRPGGTAKRMTPGVPDTLEQPPRLTYPGATTKTTQKQNQNKIFQVKKGFRNKMLGTTTKTQFKVYICASKSFITVQ